MHAYVHACLRACVRTYTCCLLLSETNEPEAECGARWGRRHYGHLAGAGASDYRWLEDLTSGEQMRERAGQWSQVGLP